MVDNSAHHVYFGTRFTEYRVYSAKTIEGTLLCYRDEKQQLLLGIRRAKRQPTNLSSSVLSSDSMHIGVLEAAANAATNNSIFTVFYNPRYVLH